MVAVEKTGPIFKRFKQKGSDMAGHLDETMDDQALALFFRGETYGSIREQLGYRSITAAQAGILRALKRSLDAKSADVVRIKEVARLERMGNKAYEAYNSGSMENGDRYLRILEQKMRLVDYPTQENHGLTASYDKTIQALRDEDNLKDSDQALIQAGRSLAAQIDYMCIHGTHQERARMMGMLPQLIQILDKLGATPEARRKIRDTADEQTNQNSPEQALAVFRSQVFAS